MKRNIVMFLINNDIEFTETVTQDKRPCIFIPYENFRRFEKYLKRIKQNHTYTPVQNYEYCKFILEV